MQQYTRGPDRLLLFAIDALRLAVDARDVAHVIARPDRITRQPGATPGRPGLFHYAGHIHRLIELAAQLELTPRADGRVLIAADEHLGLGVDAIVALVDTAHGRWQPLPSDLPRKVFPAAFLYRDQLYLFASLAALLGLEDHGPLRRHLAGRQKQQQPTKPAEPAPSPPRSAIEPIASSPTASPDSEPMSPLASTPPKPPAQPRDPAALLRSTTRPISRPATPAAGSVAARPVANSYYSPTPSCAGTADGARTAVHASPALHASSERFARPSPSPEPPTPHPAAPQTRSADARTGSLMAFTSALALVVALIVWWQPWTPLPPPNATGFPKFSPPDVPLPAPAESAPSAAETKMAPIISPAVERTPRDLIIHVPQQELRELLPPDTPAENTAQESPTMPGSGPASATGLPPASAPSNLTTEERGPGPIVKPTAPPPSPAGRPPCPRCRFTYRVVKGDTLWAIAARYLKNPYRFHQLAEASGVEDPDRIYPGDRIIIAVQ